MKRFLALLLFAFTTLSLASCSMSNVNSATGDNSDAHSESFLNNGTGAGANADTDGGSETSDGFGEPTARLSLKYDDRHTFPAKITDIMTLSVTSKQVGGNTADKEVIKIKSSTEPKVGVACGVGQAKVKLANGKIYLVTVTAAPISVLLITGQSNSEGSTTGDAAVYNKAREQSIVCEEGQIYSTYAWSTVGHATTVAGLQSDSALSTQNAKSFVAKSLTSDVSRGGSALLYPLNSLSEKGNGKVGYDSALAWNWNRLTGQKVWVVNCAAGSTYIEDWQPGNIRYKNCIALMYEVASTLKAEIEAGHYTLNHFLYFWLQGENDSKSTKEYYYEKLKTLHTNLKSSLSICGKTLDGGGNIMVRAFNVQNPSQDTVDNGPRVAQKTAINETGGAFADYFLACNVNDQWISNANISDYWSKAYPNSKYPFTSRAQTYQNPTTIAEVHTGVHYLQPGYNEIGIEAAKNAIAFVTKK